MSPSNFQKIRVPLTPKPGFCVKSTSQNSPVFKLAASTVQKDKGASPGLLTGDAEGLLSIPKGIKVFINIAWDDNVPPPPEASEETISRAMLGEEEVTWFVPVVVSEPRKGVDKAGNASIIFDAVYNTTLKSRSLKDPAFKNFLIELAMQRIESQTSVLLSRQIGTPNIKSKGTLEPRSVLIPINLYPTTHPLSSSQSQPKSGVSKLIEEISETSGKKEVKGILKNVTGAASTKNDIKIEELGEGDIEWPRMKWTREKEGDKEWLKIELSVPRLKREDIPKSALDVEEQRILFNVPGLYRFDLNLNLSDADISRTVIPKVADAEKEKEEWLKLKRVRQFDVDNAKAEWRVGEGRVILWV
ncbi:pre-RNA processing PIH1/Nop17-domain-containing protein [Abortiporus biennis]|nr:pre-RNA processing PIH1/Nop17-domain-containing protein [Abortiporus biennis]